MTGAASDPPLRFWNRTWLLRLTIRWLGPTAPCVSGGMTVLGSLRPMKPPARPGDGASGITARAGARHSRRSASGTGRSLSGGRRRGMWTRPVDTGSRKMGGVEDSARMSTTALSSGRPGTPVIGSFSCAATGVTNAADASPAATRTRAPRMPAASLRRP